MDPNATWQEVQDAIATGDRERAIELLHALLAWLERGGFMPSASAGLQGQLYDALRDLLEQLEAIGIYIPGCDEGQWADAAGLSFAQAEAALRAAKG